MSYVEFVLSHFHVLANYLSKLFVNRAFQRLPVIGGQLSDQSCGCRFAYAVRPVAVPPQDVCLAMCGRAIARRGGHSGLAAVEWPSTSARWVPVE
jgi:hypothetical protein